MLEFLSLFAGNVRTRSFSRRSVANPRCAAFEARRAFVCELALLSLQLAAGGGWRLGCRIPSFRLPERN